MSLKWIGILAVGGLILYLLFSKEQSRESLNNSQNVKSVSANTFPEPERELKKTTEEIQAPPDISRPEDSKVETTNREEKLENKPPIPWSRLGAVLAKDGGTPYSKLSGSLGEMKDNSADSPDYDWRLIYGSVGFIWWHDRSILTKMWLQPSSALMQFQKRNYAFELGLEDEGSWKTYSSRLDNPTLIANSIGDSRTHVLLSLGPQYNIETIWHVNPMVRIKDKDYRAVTGRIFSSSGDHLGTLLLIEWDTHGVRFNNFHWPPPAPFENILKSLK